MKRGLLNHYRKLTFKGQHLASWFLFIFLFLGLTSCGPKVKDLKKTSLSFNFSTVDQLLKGGIYIYGEDILTGQFFSRGLPINTGQTEVNLDLPGGRWRFFAIGWEGDKTMEGKNRCAFAGLGAPITVNGETTVVLNFSQDNCLENNIFAGTDYASSSGLFHKLKLVSCMTLSGVSNYSSTCHYPLSRMGAGQSYRVNLGGHYISPMTIQPGLTSDCISNNDIDSSEHLSNIRLPFGGLINFPLEIISYDSPNCQDSTEGPPRRQYDIVDNGPFITDFQNTSVVTNNDLDKKRILKVGDVSGTTRSHLFIPDNIFGLSKTIFNTEAPSLDCKSGGALKHCLTNASDYSNASYVYQNVKRGLKKI